MPAVRVQSVLAVAIYTLFTSTIDYLRTSRVCVRVSQCKWRLHAQGFSCSYSTLLQLAILEGVAV